MGNKVKYWSLSWSLAIPFRVNGTSTEHQNCEFTPKYHMIFDYTLSTVGHMRKGSVLGNWKTLVEEHS